MKRNSIFTALLFIGMLMVVSCSNNNSKETSVTDIKETANEKLESVIPDFRNYPQYVSCKIDGQPYVAYYNENHTTGITNSLNMPLRQDFSTSADQVNINGKTKISQLEFSFYSLQKKGEGTLTSLLDFYVQGHTDFPVNGDLKYVSFKTGSNQHLSLASSKDGILEGTFSFDVIDENDPKHILKITEGYFKFKQDKPTNLKTDVNGDINMDSLLKSIN